MTVLWWPTTAVKQAVVGAGEPTVEGLLKPNRTEGGGALSKLKVAAPGGCRACDDAMHP